MCVGRLNVRAKVRAWVVTRKEHYCGQPWSVVGSNRVGSIIPSWKFVQNQDAHLWWGWSYWSNSEVRACNTRKPVHPNVNLQARSLHAELILLGVKESEPNTNCLQRIPQTPGDCCNGLQILVNAQCKQLHSVRTMYLLPNLDQCCLLDFVFEIAKIDQALVVPTSRP